MLELPKADKKVIIVLSIVLCICAGMAFERLYQPKYKTIRIYTQALENYRTKDYSNAYYLFSRIGYFSKLKPSALYRQAMCAHALGDKNSEVESYKSLFRHFPTSRLSAEAKYKVAKMIVDKKPKKALKYFNDIILSSANEDYKIASEYYKSRIECQYNNPKMSKSDADQGFRNYLTKYSNGSLASEVASNWEKCNPKLNSKDNTLVARAYVLSGQYDEAKRVLAKTNINDSWAVEGLNSYKSGNIPKGNNLAIIGVAKYANAVSEEDYKRIVDSYVEQNESPYKSSSELFGVAKGKYKDYVWNLKCKNAPKSTKYSCYEELYGSYPNSEYAQSAMINAMIGRLLNKNYAGAQIIANDFILKYPDSNYLPMVMFWKAKIEQKYAHNPNFQIFYRNVINNFPDSYYAYRSFWIVENLKTSVINAELEYKPIEYPYKYPPKGSVLYNLILVKDYEMINKYSKDEFIKSWTEYKQNKYVASMLTAKKAMENLKTKPPKDDVRWRLVYPLNYFKQVQNTSSKYQNNSALIMAIIKEESHFNPNAQSEVGAIGLMQLMPATAHEVGIKNGYQFNTMDLLNPEFNILIGNIYYSNLRNLLNADDIAAVASYNGGIGSVKRWQNSLQYIDTDEFVEQIPYDETKDYVYKVMKSYWNYTRVYQK